MRGAYIRVKMECSAPDEFFLPEWDDIPKEFQAMIDEVGGIGCCGSGGIDLGCMSCSWSEYDWDVEDF